MLPFTPPSLQNAANSPQSIRVFQVIATALYTGLTLFTCIAVFVGGGLPQFGQPLPPFEQAPAMYAGLGLGILQIGLSFIVPSMMAAKLPNVSSLPKEQHESTYLGQFGSLLIVRLALLEGAGFFNGIALLLHKHYLSLAMIAVILMFMASQFPTQTRFDNWVYGRKQLDQFSS